MRIYDVLNAIIDKFAPLPKKDAMELQSEAATKYHKTLQELEAKIERNKAEKDKAVADSNHVAKFEKIGILEKVIQFSEQWWFKYVLAFLSIFIIRWIQNYLTESPGDDDDGEDDDFAEYLRFKRMKHAA